MYQPKGEPRSSQDRTTPALEEEYRDVLAKDAPITYEMALSAYGDPEPDLSVEKVRRAVFAVWVCLSYEWADEMIRQGSDG